MSTSPETAGVGEEDALGGGALRPFTLFHMSPFERAKWVGALLELQEYGDGDVDALAALLGRDGRDAARAARAAQAARACRLHLRSESSFAARLLLRGRGSSFRREAPRRPVSRSAASRCAAAGRAALRGCERAGLHYLCLALALNLAGALLVASVELPHEIKSAARWRRHAARRWDEARAGGLANATLTADVADWFFETFTTALARPNARAADYASALWLNERGWRCGGCPAALAANHVLELSVDEAAEVCASGVAKCEWQLAAAFHFVISLFTTIGYGDLTPSTPFGQVLVLVIALPGTGQQKRATFPPSKAPISADFHSFRLILGRAIISRNGLDAWMLFPERARAEHSR